MPVIAHLTADATNPPRIITVNRWAFQLMERADLAPPDSGQYTLKDLDAHLAKSSLDTNEKMALKGHLRDAGLIVIGKPVDTTRR